MCRPAVPPETAGANDRDPEDIINDTRPPALPQLVAALAEQDRRTTQDLLRSCGLRLRVEHLPAGPVWVIGGYDASFRAYVPRALHPLWDTLIALEQPAAVPRVIMGRWSFWREAALVLWDAGAYQTLQQRLPGVLAIYHPWAYLIWGRLQLQRGDWGAAGKYFLLSGVYSADEASYVERFKQRCQAMSVAQVRTVIPEAWQRRWARRVCPDRVLTDLADIPGPPWWQRRLPLRDHPA
ncbi:MAG TPA: hypothetical protein VGE07_27530 [Herpetosiphonaceae bacterium]